MIEQGYTNVKTVQGGGSAMEKFFDYYRGGKIISPMTGQQFDANRFKPKFKY
jgi:hypothetical protein